MVLDLILSCSQAPWRCYTLCLALWGAYQTGLVPVLAPLGILQPDPPPASPRPRVIRQPHEELSFLPACGPSLVRAVW